MWTLRGFAKKGVSMVVSLNEACLLELELIDIQSSADLRQSLQLAGSEKFWNCEVSHQKFPYSRSLSVFVLTMFGSTYTCESAFSHMNAIKTSNCASLTAEHPHHCRALKCHALSVTVISVCCHALPPHIEFLT